MKPKKLEFSYLSRTIGQVTFADGQIFCEQTVNVKEVRRILRNEIDFHKKRTARCNREIRQLEEVFSKLGTPAADTPFSW